MTSKTQTEEYLRKVELPEQTETYTVISHGEVIDKVRTALSQKGFIVETDLYKAEDGGKIALGFMQLKNDDDPDMGMTFNWSNSYNKKLRFSCGIGGFIYDNKVPFVSSNEHAAWTRKHTGTALDETLEVIDLMVESAQEHFDEVIKMKKLFQSVEISRKEYAKLIGILYFDKKILTIEQASLIRKEYDSPSFDYKETGTLWALYKLIMFAVKDQSPSKWYQQQVKISNYITLMYEQALEEKPISTVTMSEEQIEMVEKEYAYPFENVGSKPYPLNEEEGFTREPNPIEIIIMENEPVEEKSEELESIDQILNETNQPAKSLFHEEKELPVNSKPTTITNDEEVIEEKATCENCGSTNVIFNASAQMLCDNCGHEEDTGLLETDDEFYAEEEEDEELIETFLDEDTSELIEEENEDVVIFNTVEQDVLEFKNEYYGESVIENVTPVNGFKIVTLNTSEVFVL